MNEVEPGRTAWYERQREARVAELPDENCTIWAGTGARLPPPNKAAGHQPCNGCKATGKVVAWEKNYRFNVDNVKAFAAFLLDCGGFDIC